MKRVVLLALIVLVAVPCHAVAAPIVFTSSGMASGLTLDSTAPPGASIAVTQAPITTSWTIGDADTVGDSMLSANLSSTVTDNSVSAIGGFRLTRGSDDFGFIQASYLLTFTLSESMAYRLLLFGTAIQDNNQSAPANITATFKGDDVFYHDRFRGFGGLNAPPTGILLPGDYLVAISFDGSSRRNLPTDFPAGSVFGSMNLSLELAPVAVPEPTSMLLLGAGLVGAAGRRYAVRKRSE